MFKEELSVPSNISLQNLSNVLESLLGGHREDLLAKRKSARNYGWFSFFFLVCGVGLGFLFQNIWIGLALLPLFLFSLYGCIKNFGEFHFQFKERIIGPIAKHFFPEIHYSPKGKVVKSLYDQSDLFRKELSQYGGEDHFQGQTNGIRYEFSELLCTYQVSDGKKTRSETAFRGIFFVADYHRETSSMIKIQPDLAEKAFGVFGRGLQRLGDGRKLVDLENAEFERCFKVTSGSQVEARLFLTPVMMEELLRLQSRFSSPFSISISGRKFYLGIWNHKPLFDANGNTSLLTSEEAELYLSVLHFFRNTVVSLLPKPRSGLASESQKEGGPP